jgi:hypothetical protein
MYVVQGISYILGPDGQERKRSGGGVLDMGVDRK